MIPATVYSNPFARTLTRLRLSPVLMMSIRYLVRIQISRATAYSGEVFNGIASNDSRISEPAIRLFPDQTDRRLFGFVAPPVQWVIWSSRGAGRRRSTPSTLFTVSIHDRLFARRSPLFSRRTRHPGFGVPPLPTPYCRTALTGTAGHLQHWQAFGREQMRARCVCFTGRVRSLMIASKRTRPSSLTMTQSSWAVRLGYHIRR